MYLLHDYKWHNMISLHNQFVWSFLAFQEDRNLIISVEFYSAIKAKSDVFKTARFYCDLVFVNFILIIYTNLNTATN